MRKVPTSRAPECGTQKYIGSAFDEVKIVAENIETVKDVADKLDDAIAILPYVEDIGIVADNIDAVLDAPNQANLAKEAAIYAHEMAGQAHDSSVVAEEHKDSAESSMNVATQKANEAAISALTATAKATVATVKAAEAVISAKNAKESEDRSEEIYQAFAKGAVYRGSWNPKTSAYPDPKNINSYWDVILDEGVPSLVWSNITWYSGDRLIYSLPDKKYFHITRVPGVISVNGKSGAVNISLEDLAGILDLQTKKENTHLILRHSTDADYVPTAADLKLGEILINVATKTIYTKNLDDSIVSIGGGGGGIPEYVVKDADYKLESNEGILVNSIKAAKDVVLTLPTSADGLRQGDFVSAGFYSHAPYKIILKSTDHPIMGKREDFSFQTAFSVLTFSFVDAVVGWKIVSAVGESEAPNAVHTSIEVEAKKGEDTFTIAYEPTYLQVWVNGLKLAKTDFNAVNGETFTLTKPLLTDSIIQAVAFNHVNVVSLTASMVQTDQGTTVQQSLNAIANPTLFINGDFSVWQRGKSFDLTKDDYCSDHWKHRGAQTTVTQGDDIDGVKVTIVSAVNTKWMFQPIEMSKLTAKSLQGTEVSLSIDLTTDNLTALTPYLMWRNVTDSTYGEVVTFTPVELKSGNNKATAILTVPQGQFVVGKEYALIAAWYLGGDTTTPTVDSVTTFHSAKLELGSVATPFVADSPQENLAKCQRYYYVPDSNPSISAYAAVSSPHDTVTNSWACVYLPVTMRVVPTITAVSPATKNYPSATQVQFHHATTFTVDSMIADAEL